MMTKKNYEDAAKRIKMMRENETINPRFDRNRFLIACGLEDK